MLTLDQITRLKNSTPSIYKRHQENSPLKESFSKFDGNLITLPEKTFLSFVIAVQFPQNHFLWLNGDEIAEWAVRAADRSIIAFEEAARIVEKHAYSDQSRSLLYWCTNSEFPSEFKKLFTNLIDLYANNKFADETFEESKAHIIKKYNEEKELAKAAFGFERRFLPIVDKTSSSAYLGCGDFGLKTIDEISGPLLLIDKDPKMISLLKEYAKDKENVRTVCSDFLEADFSKYERANAIGLIHTFDVEQIPQAIVKIASSSEKFTIIDAERFCCLEATEAKIEAIKEAMTNFDVVYNKTSMEFHAVSGKRKMIYHEFSR